MISDLFERPEDNLIARRNRDKKVIFVCSEGLDLQRISEILFENDAELILVEHEQEIVKREVLLFDRYVFCVFAVLQRNDDVTLHVVDVIQEHYVVEPHLIVLRH